jgi:large subunit ribosomal protein L9
MKVILKEYVYKHGVAGDVVDVANGFARNFLIPKGLAEKATKDALNRNGNLLAQAAMRRQELNEQLVQGSACAQRTSRTCSRAFDKLGRRHENGIAASASGCAS